MLSDSVVGFLSFYGTDKYVISTAGRPACSAVFLFPDDDG